MRHSRAVVPARRIPIRPPPSPRRAAVAPPRGLITLTLRRRVIGAALGQPATALSLILLRGVFALKIATGALLAAIVALAIMNYQDPELSVSGTESANNETIVYRRAPPPSARLQDSDAARLQGSDAADHGEEAGLSYPRAVQTIRFVNPEPPLSIAAAAREAIKRVLIKVGAFVAFPSRESTEPESSSMRRKRGTVVLDEIDDYLWEVYQRAPIKKDSSGDFTWKDPTAARRMGLSLQDYVIGGMDPGFRERSEEHTSELKSLRH